MTWLLGLADLLDRLVDKREKLSTVCLELTVISIPSACKVYNVTDDWQQMNKALTFTSLENIPIVSCEIEATCEFITVLQLMRSTLLHLSLLSALLDKVNGWTWTDHRNSQFDFTSYTNWFLLHSLRNQSIRTTAELISKKLYHRWIPNGQEDRNDVIQFDWSD